MTIAFSFSFETNFYFSWFNYNYWVVCCIVLGVSKSGHDWATFTFTFLHCQLCFCIFFLWVIKKKKFNSVSTMILSCGHNFSLLLFCFRLLRLEFENSLFINYVNSQQLFISRSTPLHFLYFFSSRIQLP